MMQQPPQFFETPVAFRAWLQRHHKIAADLHLGFYKKDSGKPSITWPQSVAEALCFGWIDGIRRRLDDESYAVRFTPRRKTSKWSAVNVRLIAELEAAGRMTDAGRAIFAARPDPHSPGYRASKKVADLDQPRLRKFRANKAAWAFFQAQPPGYRKSAFWWVMQAKQDETRDRRLEKLIKASASAKRLV